MAGSAPFHCLRGDTHEANKETQALGCLQRLRPIDRSDRDDQSPLYPHASRQALRRPVQERTHPHLGGLRVLRRCRQGRNRDLQRVFGFRLAAGRILTRVLGAQYAELGEASWPMASDKSVNAEGAENSKKGRKKTRMWEKAESRLAGIFAVLDSRIVCLFLWVLCGKKVGFPFQP